jgi:hypothetical protein
MEGLNFNIFIIISTGLSIILIAWAFLVKSRSRNFKTDESKQFVTSSVLSLRTTLQLLLSILTIFILSLVIKSWGMGILFKRENLLLMAPFVLSLVIVLIIEPQSRKN